MIRYVGDSYAYNQCLSGSKHRTAWCRTTYPETPHPADFSAVDRYDDLAIITMHLPHGFVAGNNGFVISLYYMLFLAIFASFGAGRFSLDHLIVGKEKQ